MEKEKKVLKMLGTTKKKLERVYNTLVSDAEKAYVSGSFTYTTVRGLPMLFANIFVNSANRKIDGIAEWLYHNDRFGGYGDNFDILKYNVWACDIEDFIEEYNDELEPDEQITEITNELCIELTHENPLEFEDFETVYNRIIEHYSYLAD